MNTDRAPLGKFLAKLRIDHCENMGQMAKKLGYSAMYLSNIELGYRKIPRDLLEMIEIVYKLTDSQKTELKNACFYSPHNRIGIDKLFSVIEFLQSTSNKDDYRYHQALKDLAHIIRKEVLK